MKSKLNEALSVLPDRLKRSVLSLNEREQMAVSELRMRKGRWFSAVLYGKEYFICSDGRLMTECSDACNVLDEDIAFTFRKAFNGSVHAYPREMSEGFITICGGNRVGFCGTAVFDESGKNIESTSNISSLCIRISKEIKDCSDPIYYRVFKDGLCSVIISSAPCGGKTTVIRDLGRKLSEAYKVCIIDERGEIASVHNGIPQCDVGARTDVFNRYPKTTAIITAVRALSPDVIICDEIGQAVEIDALRYAYTSGVKLICTCHASDMNDLKSRPVAGKLIKEKAFDAAVFLGTGSMCGKIISIDKLK